MHILLIYNNTKQFLVNAIPNITSVITNTSPVFNKSVYLIANISDENIDEVNFTVYYPNGSVYSSETGTNTTYSEYSIWNSSSINLSIPATYNYTVIATDIHALQETTNGEILCAYAFGDSSRQSDCLQGS